MANRLAAAIIAAFFLISCARKPVVETREAEITWVRAAVSNECSLPGRQSVSFNGETACFSRRGYKCTVFSREKVPDAILGEVFRGCAGYRTEKVESSYAEPLIEEYRVDTVIIRWLHTNWRTYSEYNRLFDEETRRVLTERALKNRSPIGAAACASVQKIGTREFCTIRSPDDAPGQWLGEEFRHCFRFNHPDEFYHPNK